jgi:hypothetical protein
MCTEFLLAIIYFITILTVNYFLFKLLRNYFINILYLTKIKNIFQLYNPNTNKIISFFYSIEKNKLFNNKKLFNFKILLEQENFSTKSDLLVIGNIYKKLLQLTKNNSLKVKGNEFFFNLLEKQYLSEKFNIK